MDKYLELLEDEVLLTNNIVTYKWLVKNLSVPSNIAKQMLYDFVKKKKDSKVDLNVTYLVSGDKVDDKGTLVHEICLTPEASMDMVKSKFKNVTGVHIYAVHKPPLPDPSLLYSSDYHAFHSQNNVSSQRILSIVCTTLTFRSTVCVNDAESHDEKHPSKLEIKSAGDCVELKAKVIDKPSNDLKKVESKLKTVDKPSVDSKKSNGVLAKMIVNMNKKENEKKPLVTEEEKPKDKSSSTEKTKLSVKKSEPVQKSQPVKKSTENKRKNSGAKNDVKTKRRRILAMSDSSEESDSDKEDNDEPTIRPMMVDDDPEEPLPRKTIHKKEKPTQDNQIRHKRTLVEETTQDEDGYLVTKKFWKDEKEPEIKENKPLPVPVENKSPTEKPSVRQKQSTLMSFFKKK